MAELDIARIKRNVGTMIAKGAPEADIDAYVAAEGATPEVLRGGVSAKKGDTSSEADLGKHVSALEHGFTSAVAGYGETAKQFLGMKDTGDAAADYAARNAPKNYDPAFNKVKEGDLTAIPRAAVEAAPGLAADIGSTAIGGKLGGVFGTKGRIAGAALAGLTSYFGRNAGDRAKAVATEQGNTEDPTTAQKAQGAATALGEAAVNQLGLKLGVMGGGRIASTGTKGVIDAVTGLARKGATEGASNVAQDAVSQLGTTAGSEEGARIKDPASLLASGAVGGVLGTGLSAPRGARDVAGAIRERHTDTAAATRVSNRIVERAGTVEDLSDPKASFEAVSRVKADIGTELGDATKSATLSTEAQNAVNAARSGKMLSEADLAHIDGAGDPNLSSLARDANEVTRLTDRGQFGGGKFEGGMTAAAKKIVLSHPFLAMSATGAGVGGATMGGSVLLSHAAAAAPYLGALYAAGRGADYLTGARAPARSYAEKFADGVTPTRVAPAAPQPTTGARPTGPLVSPVPQPWGTEAPAAQPAPGLAEPPSGFQTLLNAAVTMANKDNRVQMQADRQARQQTVQQAMPLLRTLAAQSKPAEVPAVPVAPSQAEQLSQVLKSGKALSMALERMRKLKDKTVAGNETAIGQSAAGDVAASSPVILDSGAPLDLLAQPGFASTLKRRLSAAAAYKRATAQPKEEEAAAATVANANAGVDQGISALLSRAPAQLPAAAASPAPPPQLPGEQAPAPAAAPAAPVPSRQAQEVYRNAALAKQIADIHNEQVRRERIQAALAKAPAKPVAPPAAPVVNGTPAIAQALKSAAEPIAVKPTAGDDLGIPDFLRRTKPNGNGAIAEALATKSPMEAAVAEAAPNPYTGFQHKLENGTTFGMRPPHKEFADAGTKPIDDIVEQIVQRKKAAGELNFPERRLREFLRPILQAKRDLAYSLADTLGVDRVKMDENIQSIDPNKRSDAQAEFKRIKDTWPKQAKKIDAILSTAGRGKKDALSLWKSDQK